MICYSGNHVTRDFGVPTVRDIAIQSMRIYRFCGGGKRPWPVGMHLLLVASLVPGPFEHHALLHDSAEVVTGDIPRPMKTASAKVLEHRILERIYGSLGLKLPSAKVAQLVKRADIRAVNVEGTKGYGPRGFEDTQPAIGPYDHEASLKFHDLVEQFDPADALDSNGFWVNELESRIRKSLRRVRHAAAVREYTGPA
jgi:hypothetical protein